MTAKFAVGLINVLLYHYKSNINIKLGFFDDTYGIYNAKDTNDFEVLQQLISTNYTNRRSYTELLPMFTVVDENFITDSKKKQFAIIVTDSEYGYKQTSALLLFDNT
ncbi:hypothetical protein A3Q56_06971 [Intoshia linei]|uniref:Uncharacterized protein n=1 Tax=Intoshia linei TaxID=1819745 RepID=A0A177ATL0_9BILA|nr:hypothetical protein A3Q56_06971 [Intoshia linei]